MTGPFRRPRAAMDVDEYLAQVEEPARSVLQRLRSQIRSAAPAAQEVISYGIPTYRLHGRPLVHFAVQPRHLALYVVGPATMAALEPSLERFDVSGRTVRFRPDAPLPPGLVRRLVRSRVRETGAAQASKRPRPRTAKNVPRAAKAT